MNFTLRYRITPCVRGCYSKQMYWLVSMWC